MKRTITKILFLLLSFTAFGQSTPTEITEINSKIFGGIRKVRINIPNDYAQYPNRSYKVVYFFDAQAESFYNFTYETFKLWTKGKKTWQEISI